MLTIYKPSNETNAVISQLIALSLVEIIFLK
jgi:hypothetical protein